MINLFLFLISVLVTIITRQVLNNFADLKKIYQYNKLLYQLKHKQLGIR